MDEIDEQETGAERGGRVAFPCENCGAETTWDPDEDALSCAYCGHVKKVPRGEGLIVERALEDAGDAARGLGTEVRVKHCANCGARVSFEEASTSERCVYCGSANVLEQEANRNAIRPESLVPLDVGREEVEKKFLKWITGLWFRPNDLKKTRRFDGVGVYVPFWTFDCHVHSDWSADAGYYYYTTETYTVRVNGKTQIRTRQVQHTRWVPAWGDRDDSYDDELVLASKGIESGLMAKLGRFDTQELVPYRPEYLAGWQAEEYQVDLEDGWNLAQHAIIESQRARCRGDVPGDTQRNLRVKNRIFNVRWKHVLLPVWTLAYRYNGKTYRVLIHGQTGKIVGKAPLSWWKIAGFALGVAGVLALGALMIGLK